MPEARRRYGRRRLPCNPHHRVTSTLLPLSRPHQGDDRQGALDPPPPPISRIFLIMWGCFCRRWRSLMRWGIFCRWSIRGNRFHSGKKATRTSLPGKQPPSPLFVHVYTNNLPLPSFTQFQNFLKWSTVHVHVHVFAFLVGTLWYLAKWPSECIASRWVIKTVSVVKLLQLSIDRFNWPKCYLRMLQFELKMSNQFLIHFATVIILSS